VRVVLGLGHEARACKDQGVVVVGGGNSAGQAAMFLASRASCVRLVHRGSDLSDSMSYYLIERLRHAANVSIETSSQVVELSGNDRIRTQDLRRRRTRGGAVCRRALRHWLSLPIRRSTAQADQNGK